MIDDTRLERLIVDALTDTAPSAAPPTLVPAVLTAARQSGRRARWLALATERPMLRRPDVLVGSPNARAVTALLAAVVAGLLGTLALVAGGIVPPRNLALVPQSTATPVAFATPAPVPSPTASLPLGLVVYSVVEQLEPGEGNCTADGPDYRCVASRTWLANADGSHPRRLFPDFAGEGQVIGWSPDGTRILYMGPGTPEAPTPLILVDPLSFDREVLVTADLCAYPCAGSDGFALSPDGTRVSFVRSYPDVKNSTVVAVLDLASGTVTELKSTRTTNVSIDHQCEKSTRCEGMDDTPRWSPDGTRLVFARQHMSPEPGSTWTSGAVFVVNADGSGLERITPQGFFAIDPSWSPDGADVVFTSVEMIVNANHTSVTGERLDIYTVSADGTGLRRLTQDGISMQPSWTTGGSVAFARAVRPGDNEYENWIMGADGANQARLGLELADLTAAGCVICEYPLPSGANQSLTDAFWQPIR